MPSVFWMRTHPESHSQRQRLSSTSVAVCGGWNDRGVAAGEAGANICVLIGEVSWQLYLSKSVWRSYITHSSWHFLGALNIMTYHPVPARYIGGGNISSRSLLQSRAMRAWAADRGEPENLDVIRPDMETLSDGAWLVFPAIWLSRNEACWRAFVIISTQSESGSAEMDGLGYYKTNTTSLTYLKR